VRILIVLGLAGMLIAVLDPLEGAPAVALGAGLAALGALLGKSRYRIVLYGAFVLVLIPVLVVLASSSAGGFRTERSVWLALILPYPIGWLMGLVGAVLGLIESVRRPATAC
jgi:hypothetical protein